MEVAPDRNSVPTTPFRIYENIAALINIATGDMDELVERSSAGRRWDECKDS